MQWDAGQRHHLCRNSVPCELTESGLKTQATRTNSSAVLCSGMLAKDTICAEMAFMLMERNRPGSTIDYPMGGTKAIIDALRRGIEKNGGRIMLKSHVEEIIVEGKSLNGLPM